MQHAAQNMLEFLPGDLRERTRSLNDRPVDAGAEFVLYWMHHAVRGHDNPALDTAIEIANHLQLPVLIYQGLAGQHAYNSDRHHTFIMQGAREVQQEMIGRGIAYGFFLAPKPASPSPLKQLTARAALTLTEDFPVPPFTSWARKLAQSTPHAFWLVDTACLVPMQSITDYLPRAYLFRQATWAKYEKRILQPYQDRQPDVEPFCGDFGFDALNLASADIAELTARCHIDHMVGPVVHTRGGSVAGYQRWEQFCRYGLSQYADMRNDAAVEFPAGVSRMSAYLHHGHVSPFRMARQTALAGGPGARKFLDELLIWRELAHHFCFHHQHLATLDALPAWATQTLDDHRHDPRKPVFGWERLARAKTGDPLWDTAQKSLLIHGELHNNVRMTWGKAILQWTRSPEEALQVLIDLNHRYALDGSDPNSYGGLLWCLGLFDRPFQPEKPVIGTLRPRSTQPHTRRLDLQNYSARISRPSNVRPLRIAVVGAGLSGLMAARTLSDHGHWVRIFEKSRGTGGRMSTRRVGSLAFDHGAQYFTARDERFKHWVYHWMDCGLVQPWNGRIRVLRSGSIEHERRRHERFVGVPGMSALARHLAEGLDIHLQAEVGHVESHGGILLLTDARGDHLGEFDVVVSSAPPPQSAHLLRRVSQVSDQLAQVRMNPCWSVMLAFRHPLEVEFDGAFLHASDVAWAARNSSKPGRDAMDCWVLHASAHWSKTHMKFESGAVIDHLTNSLFRAAGKPRIDPQNAFAHRWRYAQAEHPLRVGAFWDPKSKIGICGDWCANSRIEGAFLSGAAVAGRVLGSLTHIKNDHHVG